jgi:hypothetical protein
MNCRVANPNRARIRSNANIADLDVVTAGSERGSSLKTYCDVASPGGVEAERLSTDSGVLIASGVVKKRNSTDGRI